MSGFNFSNVGFVGSIKPGIVESSYISPYPKANLFQYNDVNFGASGIVLNGAGQVTQWTNKVSGQAHLLNASSTLPSYLPNVDGFPALNTFNSGLQATLNAGYSGALTVTMLLKIVNNPAAAEYQAPVSVSHLVFYIKQTYRTLFTGPGPSYFDSADLPINRWFIITVAWSSSNSYWILDRSNPITIPNWPDTAYTMLNTSTEALTRLLLCYNRQLAPSEILNLHTQIRTEYNLP